MWITLYGAWCQFFGNGSLVYAGLDVTLNTSLPMTAAIKPWSQCGMEQESEHEHRVIDQLN